MALSRFRSVLVCVPFLVAAALPSRPASIPSAEPAPDGYISRRVEILVYPADERFEDSTRERTLRREVSLFEGYLWRHSLRRLSVDARVSVVHRLLLPAEFRDYGERFGFLLDRSPQVEADLRALGASGASLILVYDPPPGRPARLAGRTFFEGSHSSIPFTTRYFENDGFSRPLHLVLAHEYLHQIDLDFSRIRHPSEFLDPDGAGQSNYPPCIDADGGDRSMRSLLRYNRSCTPINWTLLAPVHGTWVAR